MARVPLRTLRCALLVAQISGVVVLVILGVWVLVPGAGPALSRGPPPAPPSPPDPEDAYKPPMKTILFWNRYFTGKHFGQRVGHKLFADTGCAETRCFAADHQDGGTLPLAVEDFDIVVFHGAELDLSDVPAVRKQHQRYVFLLHESAATYPQNLRPWDGFFNLSASFRRDSDIFMPYGWVAPKGSPPNSIPEKRPVWRHPTNTSTPSVGVGVLRSERHLAVWMASNCVNSPSNRDELVRALAQFTPIDVLGACGRACFQDECDRARLADHYDFYLALENSICRDYVTEKLFLALQTDLVPVVLGGADYSLVAPPGSYVDASAFASPRLLADHLLALHADRKTYNSHFWWKQHYEVQTGTTHIMCQMCALLHNTTHAPRVLRHLDAWWHRDVCATPAAQWSTWYERVRASPGVVAVLAVQKLARKSSYVSTVLGVMLAAILAYLGVVVGVKWFLANRERWRK